MKLCCLVMCLVGQANAADNPVAEGTVKSVERGKAFVVATAAGEMKFKYSPSTPVEINRTKNPTAVKDAFIPGAPIRVRYYGKKEPYNASLIQLFQHQTRINGSNTQINFNDDLLYSGPPMLRAIRAETTERGSVRFSLVIEFGSENRSDLAVICDGKTFAIAMDPRDRGFLAPVPREVIEAIAGSAKSELAFGSKRAPLDPQEIASTKRFLAELAGGGATAGYEVVRVVDAEKGSTGLKIQFRQPLALRRPQTQESVTASHVVFFAGIAGGSVDGPKLALGARSDRLHFKDNHEVVIRCNGRSVTLNDSDYEGGVAQAGGFGEIVQGSFSIKDLRELASSQAVEIRVGDYEASIPKDELPAFAALADAIASELAKQKK